MFWINIPFTGNAQYVFQGAIPSCSGVMAAGGVKKATASHCSFALPQS
jgi:hypothetical protein